ncbi:DNA-directed RNA polymerase II subunit RPB1-like isoform X2 [Pseudoliparis swirei]|uniref:DNA-directed RNA polymerase II subunit RPB1-like isoform X2 n=1 Tax=Pseudoliparis swirei TaxID=2059687 RepID=UPI0024BE3BE5|nr:DNA-directed RNA polymerase II subunit RPB1-like isoform X2 [Pseudoliparis swirei]
MMMKSRPLYVSLGMAVMSALVITATPTWATTAAGRCLDGKMFTLSRSGGGITFYAPSSAPTSSPGPTRPYDTTTWRPYYPTHKPTTTRRPYYPTTRRPYYPTTRRPYYPTHKPTILPYTTRYPYYPTTRRPYYPTHKPTILPYTTRYPYYPTPTPRPWPTRPYYTTTRCPCHHPTTTPRPWTTAPRPWTTRPYYTTTRCPCHHPTPTTPRPWPTRPYDTTTWRPYYPTHKPTILPYTTRHPYYPTHKPTILPYTTRYPYYPTHKPTTRPHHKTTTPPTTPRPWTTAPATRGVSVCLRYLADDLSSTVVTLSPSSRAPLRLGFSNGWYTLTFDPYGYSALSFRPSFRFWSNMVPDIWTRVCVTLDSMKNVAQVFSGSNISIRKMMPSKYDWSGEPVINFSGFDGQLTDVQIWDYPLRYKEVFNYMTSGIYAPYRGSALSWSNISYSSTGGALLEEAYEWQARWPIGGSGGKTWAVSNMESE